MDKGLQIKILVFLCIVFIAGTLTFAVLYGFLKVVTHNSNHSINQSQHFKQNLCQTPGCITAANRVLSSMDITADPCEDFYQFSCGGWISQHPVNSENGEISVEKQLEREADKIVKNAIESPIKVEDSDSFKKAKMYYQSCINTTQSNTLGNGSVDELINRMGGWPIRSGANVSSEWTYEDTFAKFIAKFGSSLSLQTTVTENFYRAKESIILISIAQFIYDGGFSISNTARQNGLRKIVDTTEEFDYDDYDDGYLMKTTNFLKTLSVKQQNAEELAKHISEFNDKLWGKNFFVDISNGTSTFENSEDFSLKDLNTFTNNKFNWTSYFKQLFVYAEIKSIEVNENLVVKVLNTNNIKNFVELITNETKEFIQNYLVYEVLQKNTVHISMSALQANKRASSTFDIHPFGQKSFCLSEVRNAFILPIASVFAESIKDHKETKSKVTDMSKHVKRAFKKIVKNSKWMDSATKKLALLKVNKMVEMISYPDFALNNRTKMDQSYEFLKINKENYLENLINVQAFRFRKNLQMFGKPIDRKITLVSDLTTANAYYNQLKNNFCLQMGILQPPFFDKNYPDCLNYGAVGSVIGHEITHGFDSRGAQFDSRGRFQNWWTAVSKKRFKKKTECFIKQYSDLYLPVAEANVDGELTLNENIADNGGIREAFLAYKESQKQNGVDFKLPGLSNFTSEQLFFVGFAQVFNDSFNYTTFCHNTNKGEAQFKLMEDEHSPTMFRVSTVLKNFNHFGKSFKCKKGHSTMYPDDSKTCRVW